jgi:hypothetical protein
MIDPKPNLSPAGIKANIEHYEALVAQSKDAWQQHVEQLQYWLDQLETVE